MNYQSVSSRQILVAIPYEWQKTVCDYLEQNGLSVIASSTRSNALEIVKSHELRGIITIGEWARAESDGSFPGLIENSHGKTPSVMLVSPEGFRQFFEWYNSYHSLAAEYCHVAPLSLDDLWSRMKTVGMIDPQNP